MTFFLGLVCRTTMDKWIGPFVVFAIVAVILLAVWIYTRKKVPAPVVAAAYLQGGDAVTDCVDVPLSDINYWNNKGVADWTRVDTAALQRCSGPFGSEYVYRGHRTCVGNAPFADPVAPELYGPRSGIQGGDSVETTKALAQALNTGGIHPLCPSLTDAGRARPIPKDPVMPLLL